MAMTEQEKATRQHTAAFKVRNIYPAYQVSVFWLGEALLCDVVAEGVVHFTFADMPELAEALGTERLDFAAWHGDHLCDSVTFKGCAVLRITARYT